MSDVVEIVARELEPWSWSLEPPDASSGMARARTLERAQEILAALDAAGWAVVRKDDDVLQEDILIGAGIFRAGVRKEVALKAARRAFLRHSAAAPKVLP